MKKTVVIGASDNPERYSNRAVRMLKQHGHPVIAIGLRKGEIDGVTIETSQNPIPDVDTITLYVGPQNQGPWLNYIAQLKPKRVIMNPGTENSQLHDFLIQHHIEPVEACTLVMLSIGNY